MKICYKLLYVIQGVENSFGKVSNSWPQLISEFLVAHACMFGMLHLIGLFTPHNQVFLFSTLFTLNINLYKNHSTGQKCSKQGTV